MLASNRRRQIAVAEPGRHMRFEVQKEARTTNSFWRRPRMLTWPREMPGRPDAERIVACMRVGLFDLHPLAALFSLHA